MAALITLDEVRVIAELPPSSSMADATVQLFIDAATNITDDKLASAGYSDAYLKSIQLYLACHFAVLTSEKGGLTGQTVGESEERYNDLSARLKGLASTRFGQAAIVLDTSGVLGALAASPVKGLFRVI